MSSTELKPAAHPRQRLSRETRRGQLIETAWRIIREEGTEALTLGRLAEQAGVAKPVVYGHFDTRPGLLVELYKEFDRRQTEIIDEALRASKPTLAGRAEVIASSYVECVLEQGREIPGIVAALASSPELERTKREYQLVFMEKCRAQLAPFARNGIVSSAGLWAMLGAADALSNAAATGEITAGQAKEELSGTIVAMVERSGPAQEGVG
ncbi:TetR/AcrR family transcriptional regulator [Rhizobium sp. LCM 4573]|uniref:TetR/AcrR family transcriptional regulator n=1 Tax=Rhizobium sp. LCM 4573 TaxID=1848291 RepID=UPI0008DA3017|nr:TetR/AcrR family transcriptional regulator [Rhizobium sp. LCM 4573]OHV75853.1 TetR family transcriptional regulator [Rhizobium sp. LCM 4573]